MGLYLCVVDETGEDLEGIDVGSYADFGMFRDTIVRTVEGGKLGTKCPTLILHSDSDGEWPVSQLDALVREIRTVKTAFNRLPPVPFESKWQQEVQRAFGLNPRNLCEAFIDVDGEPLLERLESLATLAKARGLPILFQ